MSLMSAIDIIDEASSKVRLKVSTLCPEAKELDKELKNISNIYNARQNEFSLLIKKNDPVYTMILDAKDKYTHGHSRRVAEYSRQIAQSTGKSLDTCEKVYFAALLHDVGKIGIPEAVLKK